MVRILITIIMSYSKPVSIERMENALRSEGVLVAFLSEEAIEKRYKDLVSRDTKFNYQDEADSAFLTKRNNHG
jgi:threonine synthase